MKRNVSVVRFKFRCNILISGKSIKEMPGSVASGTHCIWQGKEAHLFKHENVCILSLEREIIQTNVSDQIKTHILGSVLLFSPKKSHHL